MILRMARQRGLLLAAAAALLFSALVPAPVHADFWYPSFNRTIGLKLRGVAATTSCEGKIVSDNRTHPGYEYRSETHGKADTSDVPVNLVSVHSALVKVDAVASVMDVDPKDDAITNSLFAKFGHRDDYERSPSEKCPVRVRLTGSTTSSAGALWHVDRQAVMGGFETSFMFHITDPSRSCVSVKDRDFGLNSYKSCVVHGGDGIAFVIHGQGTNTVGLRADGLGYEGIPNSIALEMDTWYNPQRGDFLKDHVAIHSRGALPNLANEDGILGVPVPVPLGDGMIHAIKLQYMANMYNIPEAELEKLLPALTANQNSVTYIKDFGQYRRLGLLIIYVDDMANPLISLPINLNAALNLQEGVATVGFTAGTGRAYQKHDILSWYFCESETCLKSSMREEFSNLMHYHQQHGVFGGEPKGRQAEHWTYRVVDR